MIFFGLGVWQTYVVRRFSPTAISKAIRRKPYCGRVPPLSSPFKLTVRFLFFRSEISFAKLRRRSVTAWDHIFSDHIFLDNIFSNCKSFVFCLKDFEIVVVFC
ncbi:unnamed protein product [Brassica napus]|uniref:(rape) hypothetical protein n=1 Tax=Brassica napus TaxID=3708 RepID=A0A816LGL2_BRANA|nr:unnamed protein product [Brassica napus]